MKSFLVGTARRLTADTSGCRSSTASCPTLILPDMKMPLMNGSEFLRTYTQRPPTENPAVVIIMLTTSLNPKGVEQMQDLPINDYLTKSLTRDKINQMKQTVIDKQALRGILRALGRVCPLSGRPHVVPDLLDFVLVQRF